jgi:hypothetical protein
MKRDLFVRKELEIDYLVIYSIFISNKKLFSNMFGKNRIPTPR